MGIFLSKNNRGLSLTAKIIVKPFWKLAALCGTRYLTGTLQRLLPGAYKDMLMYLDTNEPIVAITIDDGLSRGGPSTSMTKDVLDVLRKYDATATFFVCTDYVQGDKKEEIDDNVEQKRNDNDSYLHHKEDIVSLFAHGHELGNHMQADLQFHYNKLKPQVFETKLKEAEDILEEIRSLSLQNSKNTSSSSRIVCKEKFHDNVYAKPVRWFRPPQGIMTSKMKESVDKMGLSSVFGDCYCDDWKFAQDIDRFVKLQGNSDNDDETTRKLKELDDGCCTVMRDIGKLMLSQARPGSIAIFHMPETGFREGTIYTLEEFLRGAQERGWKCCSLTNAHMRVSTRKKYCRTTI